MLKKCTQVQNDCLGFCILYIHEEELLLVKWFLAVGKMISRNANLCCMPNKSAQLHYADVGVTLIRKAMITATQMDGLLASNVHFICLLRQSFFIRPVDTRKKEKKVYPRPITLVTIRALQGETPAAMTTRILEKHRQQECRHA